MKNTSFFVLPVLFLYALLLEAIKAGTFRVDAAMYDLATGKVSMRTHREIEIVRTTHRDRLRTSTARS